MRLDARRTDAMIRNAAIMQRFVDECEVRGLRVTVGLSGTKPAKDDEPPNDLVVNVTPTRDSRDPVRLSERVTGSLGEALNMLRVQVGVGAL